MIFQKDYWKMRNEELELLAAKYKIPSMVRAGKDGESWSLDRGSIITNLASRDTALRTNWAIVISLVSLALSIVSLLTRR